MFEDKEETKCKSEKDKGKGKGKGKGGKPGEAIPGDNPPQLPMTSNGKSDIYLCPIGQSKRNIYKNYSSDGRSLYYQMWTYLRKEKHFRLVPFIALIK